MRITKQKEIIEEFFQTNRQHPTAAQVFDAVRVKNPTIGIATIYRNLAKLQEKGKIQKITNRNGVDYYDGFMEKHEHFICSCCGSIHDIELEEDQLIMKNPDQLKEFTIERVDKIIYGLCPNCKIK